MGSPFPPTMKQCVLASVFASVAAEFEFVKATISWNTTPSHTVGAELLSFTSDFHSPESLCHDEGRSPCWAGASILNVNLSEPTLKTAAKVLAPAFWRVGGSPADQTIYEFGATKCPVSCTPKIEDFCGDIISDEDKCKKCVNKHRDELQKDGCSAVQLENVCKYDGDDAFYCLRPDRWRDILTFAEESGVGIVFGLNYASHVGNGTGTLWNSTNARELIQYTHDYLASACEKKVRGHGATGFASPLVGFELGNELNIGNKEGNTTRLAQAFDLLASLIDDIWDNGDASVRKPVVIGPDVSYIHDPGNAYLESFLTAVKPTTLSAATFHHYPAGRIQGYSSGDESLLFNPQFYANVSSNFSALVSQVLKADTNPRDRPLEVWWGEGAFQFHSGTDGVTNAFEDILFSAAALGIAASSGLKVWTRQTLFGGFYEMVDHTHGFRPHADWWMAALFKRLVGASSVHHTSCNYAQLIAFAFTSCTGANATTLLLVNIGSEPVSATLAAAVSSPMTLYELGTATGDMHSHSVSLNNGSALEFRSDGSMPPLDGKPLSPSSPLVLSPRSVAFLRIGD